MNRSTRAAALLGAGLLLGACDIVLTPDRVEEGSGATVTVSNDADNAVSPFNEPCSEGSTVEVFLTDADGGAPVSQGTDTVESGNWSVDVAAPTDRGSYDIYAECTGPGGPMTLDAEELVVEPVFEPTVDPASYLVEDAPETVTVTGDWCISSEGSPEPAAPVVTATLGEETETETAGENQPFDDTWELTFTAPTEVGTHTIEVTCAYTDYVSGEPGGVSSGGEVPTSTPPTYNAETVGADVLVEVTEPDEETTTTTESTTTTTTTAAPQQVVAARAATPVRAQPTFTG